MVLDDKGAVKAERLGLDVVLDEIAKSLAAIEFGTAASRCGAAEETELHCSRFLPAISFVSDIMPRGEMFQTPYLDHPHISAA